MNERQSEPWPARPLILGHRGSPFVAPENAVASFAAALAEGADGVELDVQRSADGVPVVIHDPTLNRTGHGRGRVDRMTSRELARLRGRGHAIPTLEEAARWAVQANAWLNVEIKATDVTAETLNVLRAAGSVSRIIISSFHPEVVAEALLAGPDFQVFLLLDRWPRGAIDRISALGATGVCLRDDLATANRLTELNAAGLPVIVWTVDDEVRIGELLDAGVHAIITNRPATAVRLRG